MSEILIRGIEMPKYDNDFLELVIFNDGRCFVVVGENEVTSKTGVVTAQELQPHGRLGDLNKIEEALWEQRRQYQVLDDTQTADKIMHGLYRAEQIVKEAETIISASK